MSRFQPAWIFLRHYGTYIWLTLTIPLAIWFGYRQRHELARTWDLALNANPGWIASVFALEVVGFLLMAAVYGLVLRNLGHAVKMTVMINLHLQRVVVGAVSPMGGPSSVVVFVHRLRQRGIKPCDSLLAASIKSVSGHAAFLLILLPALFLSKPSTLMIGSTFAVVLLVAVMVLALAFLMRQQKPPALFMRLIPRRALRTVVQLRHHEFGARGLLLPFAYLVAIKAAGVLGLFFCLRAVGYEGGIDVALTAYVVGVIFTVMAPIFQGIGLVEIGMAVALQRLGVPGPMAIGATLLSRVLGMWIPLSIGLVLQFLEAARSRVRPHMGPRLA